jgi:hypothetical protein
MNELIVSTIALAALMAGTNTLAKASDAPQKLTPTRCDNMADERRNAVLTTDKLAAYVDRFNADDEELFFNIKNKDAFAFLEKHIPLFECPDEDFERTYYFRWWTFRKHVKSTPDGTVITQFLPDVGWAGKYNTIPCPGGYTYYEGRWLHDQKIMNDDSHFWLRKGGNPRSYSFPIADAFYARNLVAHHDAFLIDLLPDLIRNYEAWETGWAWAQAWIGQRDNGLFYTICDREGMEVSISGDGFRLPLNSYMYGDAKAIAEIARMAGNVQEAERFEKKAAALKGLIQDKLWDEEAQFFKVLPGERKPQARQAVSVRSDGMKKERHTWWKKERLGQEEWVQYTWKEPKRLSAAEVLWFADGGGCATPENWRLQVDEGDGFKAVAGATAYGTELDRFNRVTFAPVRAKAIRLLAQTPEGLSSGILEWRVFADDTNVATEAQTEASYTDVYGGTLKALNDGDKQPDPPLRDVKELAGLIPWHFNLPDPGYEAGWKELMDPQGFYAPYGPTFAEQRHPRFTISYEGHECQWNGPSWPMATSSVLTGLANLLNNYDQNVIGKEGYFETLGIYTRSHQLKREDGKVVPWIDENLNPFTGDWIARTRLHEWAETRPDFEKAKGGKQRGKDYNHSSYNDLIITGLVGLRPRADDVVEVYPLLPENTWDYFCLDNVLYHGHILTIIWDKTGEKYGRGRGLLVLADGKEIASSSGLSKISGRLK